jgi:hypothetical protein
MQGVDKTGFQAGNGSLGDENEQDEEHVESDRQDDPEKINLLHLYESPGNERQPGTGPKTRGTDTRAFTLPTQPPTSTPKI